MHSLNPHIEVLPRPFYFLNRLLRLPVYGLAVFIAGCCFFLAGCQPSSQNQTPPAAEITLEFWTLQLSRFKPVLEELFAAYEKEHPGIKIHWVDIPFQEGQKRALSAILSGKPPDVINLNPDFSAILAARQTLKNINTALTAQQKEIYLPVALAAASIQPENRGQEEVISGLPWYITSSVTLFNQQFLDQAGVAPPRQWHDLAPMLAAVNNISGGSAGASTTRRYGLMPAIAEKGHFLKLLFQLGYAVFDPETGQIKLISPEIVRVLNDYKHWYQQGVLPAELLTEGHQAAVGRYLAGTLAAIEIGPNFLAIIQENAPEIFQQTGIAPQFPAESPVKLFSMMLLVIPQKSPHPQEALDFARFMTANKQQLAFAEAAPVLPSTTDALKTIYARAASKPDKMSQAMAISALQLIKAKTAYPVFARQKMIHDTVDRTVQETLLGKKSAKAALAEAEAVINKGL
ncbi:MAG: extracellular solute-binding protein [Cyanobacteria bacterium P01_H01_bin.74]